MIEHFRCIHLRITEENLRNKFTYLDVDFPIAFAHRGGALDAPENSMAAFQSAVNIGYRYLETDVHLTSDGHVIAFHDDILDRVTNLSGKVSQTPLPIIKTALIEERSEIPLLVELLTAFPQARFNIDPKSDRVAEPLAEVIKQAGATSRICVSSFSDRRNHEISKLVGKGLCTGIGPSGVTRLRLGKFTNNSTVLNGQCVQVPTTIKGVPLITETFIDRVHSIGKAIHAWTINEPSEMHRLLDLGVDGIMTDKPLVLKEVLQSRNEWV